MSFLLPAPATTIQRFETKPILEIRERLERNENRDLLPAQDDRTLLASRWRIGSRIVDKKSGITGEFAVQFLHNLHWSKARNNSQEDLEVYLASIRRTEKTGADWQLGRQRIQIGKGRLLGIPNWGASSRTQDGLRVKSKEWEAIAFYPSLGIYSRPQNARFFSLSRSRGTELTYAALKAAKVSGKSTSVFTLAQENELKLSKQTFGYFVAGQLGTSEGKDLAAWQVRLDGSTPIDSKTRAIAELGWVSGGQSATKTSTFEWYFPRTNSYYGIGDVIGGRNIREFVLGINSKPSKAWEFEANYRKFDLFNKKERLFGNNGLALRRSGGEYFDPTGAAGSDVGSEINIRTYFRPNAQTEWVAGFAAFQPGKFMKSFLGNGAKSMNYYFIQYQFRL